VQSLLLRKRNEYYITGVCVFVALGIQHAMHVRYIVICGLLRSTKFFHVTSQAARFPKKKVNEHKISVLIFATTFF